MYRLLSIFLFMSMLLIPENGSLFSSPAPLMSKGKVFLGARGPRGHHGHRGHRGHTGPRGLQGLQGPQGPAGDTIYKPMAGKLVIVFQPTKINSWDNYIWRIQSSHFVIITPDQKELVIDAKKNSGEEELDVTDSFTVELSSPYVMNGTYDISIVFDLVGGEDVGLNEGGGELVAAKAASNDGMDLNNNFPLAVWYEPQGIDTNATLLSYFDTNFTISLDQLTAVTSGFPVPANCMTARYTLFNPGSAFKADATRPSTGTIIYFPEAP
jgi:hypothetical protein